MATRMAGRNDAASGENIGAVRCDRPQNGKEYLESLRDGREIYIYGERVDDVTTHPAFRNTARMTARLFDALHDPERSKKLLLPTDTFFVAQKDVFFNGEAVQILHQPAAHTDGDSLVFFRKSDVVSTGDVFTTTGYPVIRTEDGGSIDGVIAALNRIIEITVPEEKQEGGTMVIPGHGRLADEADVVEYRDMVTIIRDRIQSMIAMGMTPRQVQAAKPTADYDGRYGATSGFWTTEQFVAAAYESLSKNR